MMIYVIHDVSSLEVFYIRNTDPNRAYIKICSVLIVASSKKPKTRHST